MEVGKMWQIFIKCQVTATYHKDWNQHLKKNQYNNFEVIRTEKNNKLVWLAGFLFGFLFREEGPESLGANQDT